MASIMPIASTLSGAILDLGASTAFAGEGAAAHSHSGLFWHAWPAYWWIFPLVFFVLMAGVWIHALRRGFWGWRRWCMPWSARSWTGKALGRYPHWFSESALDVLNRRFANGEVDRREYEEIKAAITDAE